jgi:hypothetical protein
LALRKDEIHNSHQGGSYHQMRNGSREFMSTLANYKIPIAVVTTRPGKVIEEAIEAVGVHSFFDAVVTAEDVYRASLTQKCSCTLLGFSVSSRRGASCLGTPIRWWKLRMTHV